MAPRCVGVMDACGSTSAPRRRVAVDDGFARGKPEKPAVAASSCRRPASESSDP